LNGVNILLSRLEGPVNLGFITRAMANTGFSSLAYTGDIPRDHEEALRYAVHADSILESAVHADSFENLLKGSDVVIGFTPRSPFSNENLDFDKLRDFVEDTLSAGQTVGLLFGNEAHGLSNAELSSCAKMVSLPTCIEYSSMNLAQAVLVVMWELKSVEYDKNPTTIYADRDTLDIILMRLREYLELIEFFNDKNPDNVWFEIRHMVESKKITAREATLLLSIIGKSIIRYTHQLQKTEK